MSKKEEITFEQSLKRIEEIVSSLENGELELEQSMALFKEGTGLISKCTARLNEAQQKVTKLTAGENGEPMEVPFEG